MMLLLKTENRHLAIDVAEQAGQKVFRIDIFRFRKKTFFRKEIYTGMGTVTSTLPIDIEQLKNIANDLYFYLAYEYAIPPKERAYILGHVLELVRFVAQMQTGASVPVSPSVLDLEKQIEMNQFIASFVRSR